MSIKHISLIFIGLIILVYYAYANRPMSMRNIPQICLESFNNWNKVIEKYSNHLDKNIAMENARKRNEYFIKHLSEKELIKNCISKNEEAIRLIKDDGNSN